MAAASLSASQVIIVLGQSLDKHGAVPPTLSARVSSAASLHHETKLPVIVTGGDPARTGISEAAVMKELLIQQGVAEETIYVENQSLTTIQNAWFAYDIMAENKWTHFTLVTSDFHLPRACLYFEAALAKRAVDGVADAQKFDTHAAPSGLSLEASAESADQRTTRPVRRSVNQLSLIERLEQENGFLTQAVRSHFNTHAPNGIKLDVPSDDRIHEAVILVQQQLSSARAAAAAAVSAAASVATMGDHADHAGAGVSATADTAGAKHSGILSRNGAYDAMGRFWTCCGRKETGTEADPTVLICSGFSEHAGQYREDGHGGGGWQCCGAAREDWSCINSNPITAAAPCATADSMAHTGKAAAGAYDSPGARWTCCGALKDVDVCQGYQEHSSQWREDPHGGGWWGCCGGCARDFSCIPKM